MIIHEWQTYKITSLNNGMKHHTLLISTAFWSLGWFSGMEVGNSILIKTITDRSYHSIHTIWLFLVISHMDNQIKCQLDH